MFTKSSYSVRLFVYLVLALLFTPEARCEEKEESISLSLQHRQMRDLREVLADVKTIISRLDTVDDRCDSKARYEESKESLCLSLQHRQMRDLGEVLADVKTIMSLQAQHTRDVIEGTFIRDLRSDVKIVLRRQYNQFRQIRNITARLDTMDTKLDTMENVSSTLQSQQQNVMSQIDMLQCEIRAYKATGLNIPCVRNRWIVLQTRVDGAFNFPTRNWDEYKKGFGDKDKSFWIGLETMHLLTTSRPAVLRVELTASKDVKDGSRTAYKGEMRFAEYSEFRIEGEEDGYRLHLGTYSGTAGNSMRNNNGHKFSTVDRDNDDSSAHCAQREQGAWWHGVGPGCTWANLNSAYQPTGEGPAWKIIYWLDWLGDHLSYKSVTMKMRWV